jgi:heptosyltransferase-3
MKGYLPDRIPPEEIKRVLVIKLRNHGDVLLTSPVFKTLKDNLPNAEIDALVYEDTKEMLSGHPCISNIFLIKKKTKNKSLVDRIITELNLFKSLKNRNYDLLINLCGHNRGVTLKKLLSIKYAVAPKNAARSRFAKKAYTHLVGYPATGVRHIVECELDALRRIGIYPKEEQKKLILAPGDVAIEKVNQLLTANQVEVSKLVHIHPCSRWKFKCLPNTHVAHIIDEISKMGFTPVITGAPDPIEIVMIDEIIKKCAKKPINLAGQLSLKDLAALSQKSRIFLGVDSAPMHIAAAMNTPVVAIFGPSAEYSWHPWCEKYAVVTNTQYPCRPCRIAGCGNGKVSECLETLNPNHVIHKFKELLQASNI